MNELLQNFHFLRPAALWLVVPALVVWWLWKKHADPLRGWRSQVEPELLDALSDQSDSKPRAFWSLLIAWLIAAVAIAGPSWKPEPSPFADDSAPLIILLKADTSMDTPDPEPSRLERAQLKISDIAQARKGQPLGLIAYAGSAHLVLPPTKDTAAVATMAAQISPEIMPVPGDRLDLALRRASDLLSENGGTLLVVTDSATSATSEIAKAFGDAGSPDTQILVIAPVGAPIDQIEPLSRTLKAKLLPMSDDDTDIEAIVKNAARLPSARAGDGSTRWQDGGYYLLPFLAILSLLPFRRESQAQEAS
ncbi:vWA domain-containing protein [Haloferula sp.]|uniref:vWA domain-containing protein n=1 Tax=Haloferula sp. TaxID=2497595 RepID=UPI00329D7E3D